MPLRDSLLALRDRLIASERFQLWAERFPLTRPVARRRAAALFDLCAGFVYSQILHACVRLDLFETLRAGPLTCDDVACRIGLEPDAAERLLAAAAALGLTQRRSGGRWGLGPQGAALLGNAGVAAMVRHHALLYADLSDPVAAFSGARGGGDLARYWAYAGAEAPADLLSEETDCYTALMAASQPLVARQVLDAYPFGHHRRLLDVGGGSGAFLAAVGRRHPHLQLALFDLPAVAEAARVRLAAAGLAERTRVHGGDFRADPLPAGADVVSLVRIVHDHDDAAALAILKGVRQVLPDSGTLLVAEPMSGTPGAARITDAYFGVYLARMGSGRPRRPAELRGMLRAAGFSRVSQVPTRMPMLCGLVVARP